MKTTNAIYRAVEDTNGDLVPGFADTEGEPYDMGTSTTACNDDFVLHEDTSKSSLKDKVKDKKVKDKKVFIREAVVKAPKK